MKLMQKPPLSKHLVFLGGLGVPSLCVLSVYTPMRAIEPRQRWVSLDGDGDRLIYFYVDEGKSFSILREWGLTLALFSRRLPYVGR